jgi:ankyrin repeat protein
VLLCENGADIHISGQGWNPGDLAFGKSEEIVSYIASKKGSFSKSYLIKAYNLIDGWPFLSDEAIFSLDGQHPAMLAVREDLPEQLSALDQQMIELDITNKAGTPLLILAIHHRKTSAAAYLANYTKELNTTDANNKNALMHSLERGDKEISRKLISRGTKLDHLDKAGNTALHYAIARCDNDLVAELLDKGADIFAINYLSRGMMHVAAENNNEFVFSLLIANGCDVNQEDIRGNTALHLAAQANNTRILQALLTNGADFAVRNLQGKLAYDLASTQAAKQILHNRFEIEGENPAMRKLPAEVITTSPGL